MARLLRMEFAGALYHVMVRGNQGRPIFADDQNRPSFSITRTPNCVLAKTNWLPHGWNGTLVRSAPWDSLIVKARLGFSARAAYRLRRDAWFE